MSIQRRTILAMIIIAAAATLVLAPSLSSTVLATKSGPFCPSGNACQGNSGSNNPNTFCTNPNGKKVPC